VDSPRDYLDREQRLYRWLLGHARQDHRTPLSALPVSGIYFFFEAGEYALLDGSWVDRIVRVGTHRVDGRLPDRIRSHYGQLRSLNGNKDGSVFRKSVGAALLRFWNAEDPRVANWTLQGGAIEDQTAVEESVSTYLRDRMTFVCVPVAREGDRLEFEAGIIGLLARYPLAAPSEGWLGRWSPDSRVVRSGLWNSHHVDSEPLTEEQFRRLRGDGDGGGAPPLGQPEPPHRPSPAEADQCESRSSDRGGVDGMGRTLVVISCGKGKVWDRAPDAPPTPARDAYTGAPFTVNRGYAEAFADRWMVLSAKYGFIDPDFPVEDYNYSFKHASPKLVPDAILRWQVKAHGLGDFDDVIVIGGSHYRERAERAFAGTRARLHVPFAGLRQGEMMAAVKRAVESGEPLP
jgi:hypothetical protein